MIYLKLFFCFLQIGLFSFGGGYSAVPLIQSRVVEGYHWLEMSEFADLITIAEMTPGPIAVNSATFVGIRVAGPLGAIVCTLGCITPSLVIVVLLAYIYYKFHDLKTVQGVLAALRPAIVALIATAGLSILCLGIFNSSVKELTLAEFRPVETCLFVIALFLLRKFKVNPILIILGSGLVGTVIYAFI